MRVLDVNNFYSPVGGGVRTFHERRLARYREGTDIDYALVVPSDRWERVREGDATRFHVPALPVGSGYRQIVSRRGLERVVAEFDPDLVEMGSPFTLPPLLRRVLRGHRAARVAFYHSDYPHTWLGERPGKEEGRVRVALREALLERAQRHRDAVYRDQHAVLVASRFLVELLHARGIAQAVHTPLGVDTEPFAPSMRSESLRREHGIAPQERVVLFLGRLSPEKGVEELLRLLPLVAATEGLRLVVGGHGPVEGRVDAAIRGQGGRVVRIPYQRTREGVARWMASADVFLSLSPWETFSLTTLEAMACGTPVIGLPRGGVAELLEASGGGAVVRAGDADFGGAALARVQELAGWSCEERQRLSERVHATWSWPRALEGMEAVWREAVEAARQEHGPSRG